MPGTRQKLRSQTSLTSVLLYSADLSNSHHHDIIIPIDVNMIIVIYRTMDTSWFQHALDRVGATQADLARHLRLAPSAVSRMLRGERQMKQLETVQIAGFLGSQP